MAKAKTKTNRPSREVSSCGYMRSDISRVASIVGDFKSREDAGEVGTVSGAVFGGPRRVHVNFVRHRPGVTEIEFGTMQKRGEICILPAYYGKELFGGKRRCFKPGDKVSVGNYAGLGHMLSGIVEEIWHKGCEKRRR